MYIYNTCTNSRKDKVYGVYTGVCICVCVLCIRRRDVDADAMECGRGLVVEERGSIAKIYIYTYRIYNTYINAHTLLKASKL